MVFVLQNRKYATTKMSFPEFIPGVGRVFTSPCLTPPGLRRRFLLLYCVGADVKPCSINQSSAPPHSPLPSLAIIWSVASCVVCIIFNYWRIVDTLDSFISVTGANNLTWIYRDGCADYRYVWNLVWHICELLSVHFFTESGSFLRAASYQWMI